MNYVRKLKKLTGMTGWSFTDGPDTKCGEDLYLITSCETDGTYADHEAYINIDQGFVTISVDGEKIWEGEDLETGRVFECPICKSDLVHRKMLDGFEINRISKGGRIRNINSVDNGSDYVWCSANSNHIIPPELMEEVFKLVRSRIRFNG